jgi:hypothetical protein
MGMDVYGKEPSSETGKYFRRNAWRWRPLATMACTLCPKETAGCTYWQSNDGDGLDAAGSRALADSLQDKINQGAVRAYIEIRDAELKGLRDEDCDLCHGTGIRRDGVGIVNEQPERLVPYEATYQGGKHPRAGQMGWCNGCDGVGHKRPSDTWYLVDEDDVRDFIAFLRDSAGFEIN